MWHTQKEKLSCCQEELRAGEGVAELNRRSAQQLPSLGDNRLLRKRLKMAEKSNNVQEESEGLSRGPAGKILKEVTVISR